MKLHHNDNMLHCSSIFTTIIAVLISCSCILYLCQFVAINNSRFPLAGYRGQRIRRHYFQWSESCVIFSSRHRLCSVTLDKILLPQNTWLCCGE